MSRFALKLLFAVLSGSIPALLQAQTAKTPFKPGNFGFQDKHFIGIVPDDSMVSDFTATGPVAPMKMLAHWKIRSSVTGN